MTRLIEIYLLLDDEGTPRYVGQSVDARTRFLEHKRDRRWPAAYFVLQVVSFEFHPKAEKAWIALFRRLGFPLDNQNNGGAGPGICSEETKDKIRQKNKGKPKPPGFGDMIRKAQKGVPNKPFKEETIRKISESLSGRERSPEHCANLSKAKKGKPVNNPPERIEQLHAWQKDPVRSKEIYQKRGKSIKASRQRKVEADPSYGTKLGQKAWETRRAKGEEAVLNSSKRAWQTRIEKYGPNGGNKNGGRKPKAKDANL